MPKIPGYILHVFVTPEMQKQDRYTEQIFGIFAKTILNKFGKNIEWIWIGRYRDEDTENEKNCSRFDLPSSHKVNDECYRVDIRMGITKAVSEAIKTYADELAANTDYYLKMAEYDLYNDALDPKGNSKNRFIKPDSDDNERLRRAHLLKNFMDATARLYLDALVKDENSGQWGIEHNDDPGNNPDRNYLRSVLHLFHNSTKAPTRLYLKAYIAEDDKTSVDVELGTDYMQPIDFRVPKEDKWIPIPLHL